MRYRRRKKKRIILKFIIWSGAFLSIAFLAGLIADLAIKGAPHLNMHFIFSEYNESRGSHGIAPMIVTTLWIICMTLITAVPIGIFSAVYLAEYAKSGVVVRLIRFATENLAGIPSIIYGLFGYVFFKNYLKLGFSLLSGSLTLTVMILPSVIRITEEGLKSVEPAYREGSIALGATRLYTIARLIIPCAAPHILSAVLLCIGRIIGETAAVYFTAGTVYRFPEGVMNSGRTLAVHLYLLAKESGNFQEAYATAFFLVLLTALIYFSVNRITKTLLKRRS